MVIGYSFSDAHINKAIGDGIDKGLKLFIIDPCGVDVLDKGLIRDEYMEKLAPNIIGASRRPLRSSFSYWRSSVGACSPFLSHLQLNTFTPLTPLTPTLLGENDCVNLIRNSSWAFWPAGH